MDGCELGKPRDITSVGKHVGMFVDIGGRTVKLFSIDEHDACRIKENNTFQIKTVFYYLCVFLFDPVLHVKANHVCQTARRSQIL